MSWQRPVAFAVPFLSAFAGGVYFATDRSASAPVPKFSQVESPSPARPAVEPPPVDPQPAPAEDPWKINGWEYSGPDGEYRLWFPTKPTTNFLPSSPAYRSTVQYVAYDGPATYQFMRFELAGAPPNAAAFLTGVIQGATKHVRLDRPATEIELDGHPGREGFGRNAKGLFVRLRAYSAGKLAFVVSVAAPTKEQLTDESAEKFFTSLAIGRRGSN